MSSLQIHEPVPLNLPGLPARHGLNMSRDMVPIEKRIPMLNEGNDTETNNNVHIHWRPVNPHLIPSYAKTTTSYYEVKYS